MTSQSPRLRDLWRDPAAIASFCLTWGGLALGLSLHHAFFSLIAVGLFGPTLLRGIGFVEQDEFRVETSRRAAETALVVTGVFLAGALTMLSTSSNSATTNSTQAEIRGEVIPWVVERGICPPALQACVDPVQGTISPL